MEVATKRAFVGALDWPGWCRPGRDADAALEALFENGPRYGKAIASARLGFKPPKRASDLRVVERLKGGATTDFGAPEATPKRDTKPLGDAERRQWERLLKACWRSFDASVNAAKGKTLRKGPRGGGRSLKAIVDHVVGAEGGYLSALGWKVTGDGTEPERTRTAILDGLAASARGEIDPVGPRGGKRWVPRYFIRRTAWHALDHCWEIEDRSG